MVTLEAKLAFLRQPASYPFPVSRVEAIETHMSWVFLTERKVFKMKKPVNYGMPDFSTLEARHAFCEEEIRLNRRLAPDIYLAALPLTLDAGGQLAIDGHGEAVEWLVTMRRLPAERMLDHVIRSGSATEDDMVRIATCLAAFYQNCTPVALAPVVYQQRFAEDIAVSHDVLVQPDFGLPARLVNATYAAQQLALGRVARMLEERAGGRHIVEGHGDLRAEHVCLDNGVQIIDCLEFSRDLRIVDPYDELAFLALECERLGASSLGNNLITAYSTSSGDAVPASLIHFYKSVRAALRARLAIRHLAEEAFRHSPSWAQRAIQYLELAESHARLV